MIVRKFSRQREAILENLRSRRDHPTADTLYRTLRADYPHISLGTVYRNLNLLADLGEISRIRCPEGMERFDADTHEHYHLYCRSCGRVLDLPMDPIPDLDSRAAETGCGRVDGHSLLFFGACSDCGEAVPEESDRAGNAAAT